MELVFKCPECSKLARIQMSDEEASNVRQRIIDEGRSPTVIVRCETNHELIVTLYNLRDGTGLGVRDIVVPVRSESDQSKKKTGSKEVDWLAKAFGGE